MPSEVQIFLRRTVPVAVLAAIFSTGSLQADEKPGEVRPGIESPVKENDRAATRDKHLLAGRQHVRQAIAHLHAADLHDLAEMVGQRVRNELRDGEVRGRAHHPDSQHEHDLGHEHSIGHEQVHRGNNHVWRMISQLGQAIRNLEGCVRESDEMRRTVEDVHRNVGHMQRDIDLRFREIELAVRHHVRDAQRVVEGRSGKFEEVVKNVERHIEERIGEIEYRLEELQEHLGGKDHGHQKDEYHGRDHHRNYHSSDDREDDHEQP
ncbi:MAG: hypothetical protein MK171_09190 [Pirellulales bacterium]|nr:hypothetical protein [Pirellulales bacterium]